MPDTIIPSSLNDGWSETLRFVGDAVFAYSPVAIAVLDLGGVVSAGNLAFLAMTGLAHDEVIGKPFIDRLFKEDREDVSGPLSKLAMGTMPAVDVDGIRMLGAKQNPRRVSVRARRADVDHGDDCSDCLVVVHVLEEAERPTVDGHHIQAQKMQALGQLAGGIAHDFNNLLTAMLGHCDLVLDRHPSEDPDHDDITQIRANVSRASELVRQLLAFSRKQALTPVAVDVNHAVEKLTSLLDRVLGETIELRLMLTSEAGVVRVDPGQLDQMIINLAVNARDAMPGGGRLSIRTADIDLTAPLEREPDTIPPGSYVVIDVSDTGVGIAKEIIASIFEPFFTTKEVGAGTGLGLATVYGIVRQTDGFVVVDSAVGEGASFTLYLPAATPDENGEGEATSAAETASQPEKSPTGSFSGATVLLVEDEHAVRKIAAKALSTKGYQVLEACDGESALEVLGARPDDVDLILTDVVMPGMDGGTLARLVRQELPLLPVIMMSGYADEAQTPDLADVPASHFLAKPFTLAQLTAKVKGALSREEHSR